MSRKKDPKGARARILAAAEEIFAREGYAQARTQDIADRASVNKAMLFYYYESKDRLFEAVLERLFQAIAGGVRAEVLDPARPEGARIDRILARSKDFWQEHPGFLRLVAASRKADPERHERLLARHLKPLYDELTVHLEKGAAAGVYRPVDARQFIFSIGSALRGYLSGCAIPGAPGAEPESRARDFDAGMANLSYLVRSSLLAHRAA